MDGLILSATVIGLGVYNWILHTKLQQAKNQTEMYFEMILAMAEELSRYGSPNVKVLPIEKVQ